MDDNARRDLQIMQAAQENMLAAVIGPRITPPRVVTDSLFPTTPPPPPDIERMTWQGCVADGFLSGYGNEGRNIELINRLPCYYLHRAVETWLSPPNWEKVDKIRREVTRTPVLYGMFIAEAVDMRAKYWDLDRREWLSFKKMCKDGSDGRWGNRTCVPTTDKKEYRRYLVRVMKDAIDHDIQSFLFGQVYLQDARTYKDSHLPDILEEVRDYARQRGTEVVIGAQTNAITDKKYLHLFDYVEGGTGLKPDGTVEDGACFSRYQQQGWCWALLWDETYRAKAPKVLIHLDWSGMENDDMATFVEMPQEQRGRVLRYLYKFFHTQGVGFLLPVFTALPNDHDGCHGSKERYYSADDQYSCDDENAIADILTEKY